MGATYDRHGFLCFMLFVFSASSLFLNLYHVMECLEDLQFSSPPVVLYIELNAVLTL